MSSDPSYYAARAAEARRLAMASSDPKVRKIHLEMAAKYAALAGSDVVSTGAAPADAESEQRSA